MEALKHQITSMTNAIRVAWVKHLISRKWKAIIEDLIKPISLNDFLQMNLLKDDIAIIFL